MARRYKTLAKLGEGTYGIVYKAYDILEDVFVAIKEIPTVDEDKNGLSSVLIKEVAILKTVNHQNIIKLVDLLLTNEKCYLVFEYAEKDLYRHMKENGIFHPEKVRKIMFQLLCGLCYLHDQGIVHRDIKPQNILLTGKGDVKITDFGISRIITNTERIYNSEVVTLWYRPPEVLLGYKKYGFPVDIWALGALFYELSTGSPLFPGSNEENQLDLVFKIIGTPSIEDISKYSNKRKHVCYPGTNFLNKITGLSREGKNLLKQMLNFHPSDRPSASDALKHVYFSEGVEEIEPLY